MYHNLIQIKMKNNFYYFFFYNLDIMKSKKLQLYLCPKMVNIIRIYLFCVNMSFSFSLKKMLFLF